MKAQAHKSLRWAPTVLVLLSIFFLSPELVWGETKSIAGQSVAESGCPVEISSARADLELDPFGVPVAIKTYIDYKNDAAKPIIAVKFRVRFCDADGHDKGTFEGEDEKNVAPAAQASKKWLNERVYPQISFLKVRVLEVKYADGSQWESEKMQEILHSQGPPQP